MRCILALTLVAAMALAGCSKKGPVIVKHEVYPVEGRVIWKGKPLGGANITFHPRGWETHDFTAHPAAITDPDGHYRLSTYGKGDGAPAGKYAVTVTAPDRSPKAPKMYAPNILPKEFASPDTSGLETEVVQGNNEVPALDLGGEPEKDSTEKGSTEKKAKG
jgi:hypothetical protein